MDYEGRLAKLRSRMSAEGLNGFFVTNMFSVRYLSGFTGSTGALFVGPSEARLLVDGRYAIRARREVGGAEVTNYTSKDEYPQLLADLGKASDRIGFEAGHVTVLARGETLEPPDGLDRVKRYFNGSELVPTVRWVEDQRQYKEPAEVDAIRSAAALADEGFKFILDRIEVGMPERDLALELEIHMRRNGADGVSFSPIVAAAANSALPHATPSDQPIEKGRYLLMDFGAIYKGYCSDLTRTVLIGPADDRHREVYSRVSEAQLAGLEMMKPGTVEGDAHEAALAVFGRAGYPEAFSHGLGHGVGLEIHEERPNLKSGFQGTIEPGHIVTVEPGVYFEGWGGVRIEDLVVITADGHEVLSHAPKELIVL